MIVTVVDAISTIPSNPKKKTPPKPSLPKVKTEAQSNSRKKLANNYSLICFFKIVKRGRRKSAMRRKKKSNKESVIMMDTCSTEHVAMDEAVDAGEEDTVAGQKEEVVEMEKTRRSKY
jgi:hypothetical protein